MKRGWYKFVNVSLQTDANIYLLLRPLFSSLRLDLDIACDSLRMHWRRYHLMVLGQQQQNNKAFELDLMIYRRLFESHLLSLRRLLCDQICFAGDSFRTESSCSSPFSYYHHLNSHDGFYRHGYPDYSHSSNSSGGKSRYSDSYSKSMAPIVIISSSRSDRASHLIVIRH